MFFKSYLWPFLFKSVLQKYQVERIYDLFGIENPYRVAGEAAELNSQKKKEIRGITNYYWLRMHRVIKTWLSYVLWDIWKAYTVNGLVLIRN